MEKYIRTKLGYGNPEGDFWFIGPEEGGSIASLTERIRIWEVLGENQSFLDMRSFHLSFKNGTERFFEGDIIMQKTWGGLIEILFGMNNENLTSDTKRRYQSTHLGSSEGNTVLAELFPFASRSLNDTEWDAYFVGPKEIYWEKLAQIRIDLLVSNIQKYAPKLVVFYSTSFNHYWHVMLQKLNAEKLPIENDSLPVSLYKAHNLKLAIIPHPVSFQMNGSIKREIGEALGRIL